MKKLSDTQLRTLWAMPFTMTFWGGKPFTSWPVPGMTIRTIEALERRGLVRCTYAGTRVTYHRSTAPALGKPGEP